MMDDTFSPNWVETVDLAVEREAAQPAATIMSESPATITEVRPSGSPIQVGEM
jgi:hypothetical protein